MRKGPRENTQELRKTIPTGGWGLTCKYTTQHVSAQCALNGTARRDAYCRNGFRSALKKYWNVLATNHARKGKGRAARKERETTARPTTPGNRRGNPGWCGNTTTIIPQSAGI